MLIVSYKFVNYCSRLSRLFGTFELSLRCNGLKPSRAKHRAAPRVRRATCVTAVRVHARLVFARVCICSGRYTCFVQPTARLLAPRRNFISRMFDLRKKIALTRSAGFIFCKPRRIFNNFSVFLDTENARCTIMYDRRSPFPCGIQMDNAFLH